ncbi:uncharacterized protein [Linepithema humile]|uniref:uncharacterized protein isoform X2 n=1 Tax=Linepithema humile TaxID=83485 RepID=UPI00351DB73D
MPSPMQSPHAVPIQIFLSIDRHASHQSAKIVRKDVNLNEAVDTLLPYIHTFILDNGMDPMKLIDFSEAIFPELPGIAKGNVDFKKGWMQNLSKIQRSNDVTASYKDKRLILDMNLGFNLLDFNYEYYLKHMVYERQGDVYGRFYDLKINTVVTIDLANYYLSLNSLKFSEVSKYDLKFEGNLVDPILNILTKIVTVVFRKCVLLAIEDHATLIFGAKIDEWNKMIPRPNRTRLIEDWLDRFSKV